MMMNFIDWMNICLQKGRCCYCESFADQRWRIIRWIKVLIKSCMLFLFFHPTDICHVLTRDLYYFEYTIDENFISQQITTVNLHDSNYLVRRCNEKSTTMLFLFSQSTCCWSRAMCASKLFSNVFAQQTNNQKNWQSHQITS